LKFNKKKKMKHATQRHEHRGHKQEHKMWNHIFIMLKL
jgi:hypothetical protein